MANALNLLTIGNGTVNSTTNNGAGTIPVREDQSLANILAACVNSTGPGSSSCTTLFNATGVSTSTGDTAAAAIALAQSPFLRHHGDERVRPEQLDLCPVSPGPGPLPRGLDARPCNTRRSRARAYSSIRRRWTPAGTCGPAAPTRPTPPPRSPSTARKGPKIASSSVTGAANTLSPAIHLAIDSSDTVYSGFAGGHVQAGFRWRLPDNHVATEAAALPGH